MSLTAKFHLCLNIEKVKAFLSDSNHAYSRTFSNLKLLPGIIFFLFDQSCPTQQSRTNSDPLSSDWCKYVFCHSSS